MKSVTKFLLIILFCVQCSSSEFKETSLTSVDSTIVLDALTSRVIFSHQFIDSAMNIVISDHDSVADSSFYPLLVENDIEHNYYSDNGKFLFLVTNRLISLNRDFGIDNQQNWIEAIAYYEQNQSEFEEKILRKEVIVSVLKKGRYFEPIWVWYNFIGKEKGGYSIIDSYIELNQSVGLNGNCLKIILKDMNKHTENDIYVLNYLNNSDSWYLVSRESVNSLIDYDKAKGSGGYCIDTSNNYVQKSGNYFILTDNYFFDLNNPVCYD